MSRLKRIITTMILFVAIGVAPVFANFPVIDFSSITNSIQQFITTVQHYAQVVQDMKENYERIKTAAQTIAKGDFNSIMNGIGDMVSVMGQAGQLNAVFGDFMDSVGNTTQLVQQYGNYLMSMPGQMQNAWSFLENLDSDNMSENILDGVFGTLDALGDSAIIYAKYFGSAANVVNGAMTMGLAAAQLGGEDNGIKYLQGLIDDLNVKIGDAQKELLQAENDQNTTKANQLAETIDGYQHQINEYRQAIAEMQRSQQELLEQQEKYNKRAEEQLSAQAIIQLEAARKQQEAEWAAMANSMKPGVNYNKKTSNTNTNTSARL